MEEAFSSIDQVGQCLIDEARTNAFREAIEKTVRPGDVVVDMGTGSGVLALFAARAKAGKVFAIEYDPYVASIARKIVSQNGFDGIVEIVLGDARSDIFSQIPPADVVVGEMLTTGLVDEFQVASIQNLRNQGIITEKTKLIPEMQHTFATLISKDFGLYGFDFVMVEHLWNNLSENQKRELLSDTVLFDSFDFQKSATKGFTGEVTLTGTKNGVANALYLTSTVQFSPDHIIADTETLNAPVVIPLEKPVDIAPGKKITLGLDYAYGSGYQNFHISVI